MAIDVRFGTKLRNLSARWVRKIVAKTLALEKKKGYSVSILLTDNREVRRINRRYLHHDYATDVISFWLDRGTLTPKEASHLGDMAVSVQMARSMSKRLGVPFKEELARYLIHGTLHLLGYNDVVKKDRIRMHRRQESILKIIFHEKKNFSSKFK